MDYKRGGIRLTYRWGVERGRKKLLDSLLFLVYAFTRKETRKKALIFRVPVPSTQNILSKIVREKKSFNPTRTPFARWKVQHFKVAVKPKREISSSRRYHLQDVPVGNGKLLLFRQFSGEEVVFLYDYTAQRSAKQPTVQCPGGI